MFLMIYNFTKIFIKTRVDFQQVAKLEDDISKFFSF